MSDYYDEPGDPRNERWDDKTNELLYELGGFAFNRTVSRRAFGDALMKAIKDWSLTDASHVGAYIARTRTNSFMPTIAQIVSARKQMYEEQKRGLEVAEILCDKISELLPMKFKDEDERLTTLFDAHTHAIICALVTHHFKPLLERAYVIGAQEGARRAGMSPEKLEILGKHLIASARDAMEEDRYQ